MGDRDLQLVRAASEGDTTAFDLLVYRYSEQIYRLALRMLGNREDAEDVQQETFVSAFRSLRRFRGDSSFGTWAYAIAARLCLSRRRRSARREEKLEAEMDLIAAPAGNDPEDRLLAAESAYRVQAVLGQLSPPDRLLIVLKYIEGLSHDEIAEVLGCSEQSSRARLSRAKRLFRERYERM